MADTLIAIGELSRRSGVAASGLRYYEELGLITSVRRPHGARHYARSMLRRVAYVQAAQRVGLSLAEIKASLALLPEGRTPTRRDWERVSRAWRGRVDLRIAELEQLREGLTSCIGCGCLSLRSCTLLNPQDALAARGPGAHRLAAPG